MYRPTLLCPSQAGWVRARPLACLHARSRNIWGSARCALTWSDQRHRDMKRWVLKDTRLKIMTRWDEFTPVKTEEQGDEEFPPQQVNSPLHLDFYSICPQVSFYSSISPCLAYCSYVSVINTSICGVTRV